MGRSEKEARPRLLTFSRLFHVHGNNGSAQCGRRGSASTGCSSALALAATAILIALVLLDGQPASAALILGGFGLGIAFPESRIQLHRVVAAFPDARGGGRPARRADRDRGRRAGGRAGGRAQAEFRRRHRAARALAADRRLRVRHRHAARQWLRLRHALHRRRRLRAHADRAVVLRHRQRVRQPVAAVVPRARRHRSGAGVGLSRALGRTGGDAGEHRAGRRR